MTRGVRDGDVAFDDVVYLDLIWTCARVINISS